MPDDSTINARVPVEWDSAPIGHVTLCGQIHLDPERGCAGGHGYVLNSWLTDGTLITSIVEPDGARHVRTSPSTGWAIEERYVGEITSHSMLRLLWADLVEQARGYRDKVQGADL